MNGTSSKNGIGWLFLCLPVILLPLTNLLTAAVSDSSIAAAAYIAPSRLIPFLPEAVVFILGAIIEELFYRWLLLKKVFFQTTKLKPLRSILIISVLFAGMHLWNRKRQGTVLCLAKSRHEARDETWMHRGEGAKRAADYLIRKYEELTQVPVQNQK